MFRSDKLWQGGGVAFREATSTASGSHSFPITQWSNVLAAGNSGSAEADLALEDLCRRYWFPVYAYVRRSGHNPDVAQDLTQEFFRRLVQHELVVGADKTKGRFRSYLLTILKRFLVNEWQATQAAKRGGGRQIISFNAMEAEEWYRLEPVDRMTADRLFDRRWALALLNTVMNTLNAEQEEAGKRELFQFLVPFLYGEAGELSQAAIAAQFGLSESAVKSTVHRLRLRYRELLRVEVARTLEVPMEAEEELQQLLVALRLD